jgi:hypothetical protein
MFDIQLEGLAPYGTWKDKKVCRDPRRVAIVCAKGLKRPQQLPANISRVIDSLISSPQWKRAAVRVWALEEIHSEANAEVAKYMRALAALRFAAEENGQPPPPWPDEQRLYTSQVLHAWNRVRTEPGTGPGHGGWRGTFGWVFGNTTKLQMPPVAPPPLPAPTASARRRKPDDEDEDDEKGPPPAPARRHGPADMDEDDLPPPPPVQ